MEKFTGLLGSLRPTYENQACAQEHAVAISNRFQMLSELEDQREFCDTFKHESVNGTEECIEECQKNGTSSSETLKNIEESHASRLAENSHRYRDLSRRTSLLRKVMKYLRGLDGNVEGCLNANALRSTLKKLSLDPH